MPKERGQKLVASNKRARYDYFIEKVYEAGIVLSGTEVKSLREGKASLNDSYGLIENGEIWLENAYIPELTQGTWTNHLPRRKRKLLLSKREIAQIANFSREVGYTIVPISLYFKDGYAKVEICVARGKKSFDKREAERKKGDIREIHRHLKSISD
jgi:SsrA-binding protein